MIIKVYLFDVQGYVATLDKATTLKLEIDHISLIELTKILGRAIGEELAKKEDKQ
jgi:hypothetical protein